MSFSRFASHCGARSMKAMSNLAVSVDSTCMFRGGKLRGQIPRTLHFPHVHYESVPEEAVSPGLKRRALPRRALCSLPVPTLLYSVLGTQQVWAGVRTLRCPKLLEEAW